MMKKGLFWGIIMLFLSGMLLADEIIAVLCISALNNKFSSPRQVGIIEFKSQAHIKVGGLEGNNKFVDTFPELVTTYVLSEKDIKFVDPHIEIKFKDSLPKTKREQALFVAAYWYQQKVEADFMGNNSQQSANLELMLKTLEERGQVTRTEIKNYFLNEKSGLREAIEKLPR